MLPWDHAQAWSDSLSAQPPGHRDQRAECGPRFHAIHKKPTEKGSTKERMRSYDEDSSKIMKGRDCSTRKDLSHWHLWIGNDESKRESKSGEKREI